MSPCSKSVFSTQQRLVTLTLRRAIRVVGVVVAIFAMSSTTKKHMMARAFSAIPTASTIHPYEPPEWTRDILENVPTSGRLHLCNLPTALYKLQAPPTRSRGTDNHENSNDETTTILGSLEDLGISLYIKRDDATGGVEIGGNKLRKLEFLLADALTNDHDSVVTIGGQQSNHCRATASVCRMLGLEPHLILRTKEAESIPRTLTGNLMVDRMVGSNIYTCTPGEYGRVGSDALVERLCTYLQHQDKQKQKNPYAIGVGGSNALGSWGYINAVDEVMGQWSQMRDSMGCFPRLDHVVFACGSGGTATGIALGMALCRPNSPKVHAIGVCDNPDYFYDSCSQIANDMGLVLPSYTNSKEFLKEHMVVHQGKGKGYASSTPEELEFVTQFALETGIILDPVYSGKALYHFVTHVIKEDPETYRGKKVLFWHTGGALGMYDKEDALLPLLNANRGGGRGISSVKRLDVYGSDKERGTDDSDEATISI